MTQQTAALKVPSCIGQHDGLNGAAQRQLEFLQATCSGRDLKRAIESSYGLLLAMVNDIKLPVCDRSLEVAQIQAQVYEAMAIFKEALNELR